MTPVGRRPLKLRRSTRMKGGADPRKPAVPPVHQYLILQSPVAAGLVARVVELPKLEAAADVQRKVTW